MRHPRRRHRKPVARWAVKASSRPLSFRVEGDRWIIGIDRKHFLPWTPNRGRSRHYLEAR